MAKSKKRGGATAHRKRITVRNQKIKGEMKKQSNLLKEAMMEQLEKLRSESGDTQNAEIVTGEEIKLNTDGFIQSPEII
jgi:hypothetical protein